MKIIQNGVKVEKSYQEVCKELGNYIPDVNFVKVTNAGTVSFWAGNPHEVRALLSNVLAHGFKPAASLVTAARG